MSYREENGQVILTMSPEDYGDLLWELNLNLSGVHPDGLIAKKLNGLLNRLNEGNPHYTPYQVKS